MPRFLSALFLLTLGLSAADVFEQQRQLGRGLNMGNMLEAPTEGAWGLRVADEDFPRIKAAGFDSVRIPTKWSAHAAKEAPYTIDAEFMDRVEHIVKTALAAKLTVLLNLHHYDEMDKEPAQHRERFTAFWKQISTRFAAYPDSLQFELFNEPNGNHSAAEWNQSLLAGLREVRRVNPERAVHIGSVRWNQISTLKDLKLPADDRHIVVHIHYYSPYHFTHANAFWVKGSDTWKDSNWTGTESELALIRKDFDQAAAWGKQEHRPLFLGEFGTCGGVPDMAARAKWTHTVVSEAETRGIKWAYWEYQANFGVWDPKKKEWRQELLNALVGK
jgi:endoglucanase